MHLVVVVTVRVMSWHSFSRECEGFLTQDPVDSRNLVTTQIKAQGETVVIEKCSIGPEAERWEHLVAAVCIFMMCGWIQLQQR